MEIQMAQHINNALTFFLFLTTYVYLYGITGSFSLTSSLSTSDLFPCLARKCSGESIAPKLQSSENLSWSVRVVAEIPASGPRLGREPAVSEGSGICPGIMSGPATATAT